jgi:hypothetical protein
MTATAANVQTPPKMKMTTDIPPEITTPDSVETRLGALTFFDGLPDKATVKKVYDNPNFRFTEHVDVQVGRVIDEIDEHSYGDNTLIF